MYRLFPAAATILFVASAAFTNPALADACAGGTSSFTDVPDGVNYCTNAQWMKNRAITLGCGNGTIYCPNDAVTRASMALFMNRLGTALTPTIIHTFDHVVSPAPLFVPGDSGHGSAICLTSVLAAANYPRTATISGFVSGANASAAMRLHAGGILSLNAAAYNVSGEYALASVGTASAASAPVTGAFAIPAGQTAALGVFVYQDGAANGATLGEMDCDLIIRIENKNGTSPPF